MTPFLDEGLTQFLQRVAEAVATVLRFEVTIADSRPVRVAGTGRYAALVGQAAPPSSSWVRVMQTGKPTIMVSSREEAACSQCEGQQACVETCHIAYPLNVDGKPAGAIALVGFTEEQRLRMLSHKSEYLAFVEHMARLVEIAAQSARTAQELKEARDQLRGVVEAVREGIVAVDASGTVMCCNEAAQKLLRLRDPIGLDFAATFPDAPMLRILKTGTGYANLEVTISSPEGPLRHVSSGDPLYSNGRVVGAVALLKSLEDVTRIAYEMSESQPDWPINNILGQATVLQDAKRLALRAAQGTATVLLRGESGTGKELFARAIHFHSPRGRGPFVAVNCAAVPEDLLESELFGYEEGAFTGARKGGKPGKFEMAHQGTLFLDEVADCSLRLQAKLLRVLDSGEVHRVGGTRNLSVNVRTVAATNKDLEQMVSQGEFREDLYFRLNVIPINIPPLRDRPSDILPLFQYFMRRHASSMGVGVPVMGIDAQKALREYRWPGNVRELENVAQYALHSCTGDCLEVGHLPPRLLERPGDSGVPVLASSEWERRAIAEGLKRLAGTARAKEVLARQLGMGRSTIYRKIREYGLE